MNTFAFLDLGTTQLLMILALALLLFGGKKLPELSKALGQSVKELRSSMSDEKDKPAARQDNRAS